MSDIYDEIGQQLHHAAARTLGGRARTSGFRSPLRVFLAACATLTVAGTAAAATGVWSPTLGGGDGQDAPQPAATPVPGDEQAMLGVLRRPQTSMDRGPEVQAQLQLLVGSEDRGIRLDGVRRLGTGPGGDTAIVLIPKESFGETSPAATKAPTTDALCVSYPNPAPKVIGRRSSASSCWSLKQILSGGAVGVAPVDQGYSYYGLVPDNVTKVVARRRDGSTAAADVHDNFFDLRSTSGDLADAVPVGRPRWLDGAGRDIRPDS
ncbi:MAG TPA: hypothetical protein VGM33_00490 [Baekduia sp.]|jgi:hypothetical protein